MNPEDLGTQGDHGSGFIRFVVSGVLGGLLLFLAMTGELGFSPWPLLGLLGVFTALSFRQRRALSRGTQATAESIFDLVFVSILVSATGGVDSPVVPLFAVVILIAGLRVGATGAVLASIGSIAVFATVAAYVGGLDGSLTAARVGYQVALHGGAFLTLAVLTGALAGRAQRSRVEAAVATQELHRVLTSTDRILEHMPVGILTASAGGRIVRANQAVRDLLRLPPETDLVGRDLGSFLAESSPSLVDAMEDVLITRKWAVREEIVLWRESQMHPVGVSFAPLIQDDDTLEGLIVTFADLKQARRMEREMRRSEQLAALGELAAGVAHEIRNPLASISGAVQVLDAEGGRDTEERELMELIVNESARLNRIIDGVLDYTQDHSKSRRIHDVSQTAREVVRLVRHDRALTVGKTLLLEFADGQDFRAEVEENGLKQVFLNLVRNALQSMSVGGILRVTGELHDGRIFVVFRDTGTGIAPQDMEDIFKPFHTSKKGGTGLGLSIASRIVEGNGGTIQVKSTPGIGTVFTVELPAIGADGKGERPVRPDASPQETALSDPTTTTEQPAEATPAWPMNES
ncbi:MAG: PAS domain-containing sensor histidine kinase [Gemmatimonadota bacterium]|nr:MAG: PAS domain-containing sensor histidine kinase [Gemmatimonadota bacterium]